MRMKIADLFNRRSLDQSTQSKGQGSVATESGARASEEKPRQNEEGADRVSISPLGRQFAQLSEILGDDEAKRREKIASLKKKIEAGEYKVNSTELAKAILEFAQDGSGV